MMLGITMYGRVCLGDEGVFFVVRKLVSTGFVAVTGWIDDITQNDQTGKTNPQKRLYRVLLLVDEFHCCLAKKIGFPT